MKVAIAHDYLTLRGGAERVVLAMARAFPDASVYTTLYEPAHTYDEFRALDVHTSPLNRLRLFRRNHRVALPLLAPSFRAMRVDADVVVCSTSGWAHGINTPAPKVVYCYAPARWLYQSGAYSRGLGRMARIALATLSPALRTWDRRAAGKAARLVAISSFSRNMIQRAWGIDAEVLYPPVTFDTEAPNAPMDGLHPGYWLCVSRLLPYKRVDLVADAFASLQLPLVVAGGGPLLGALRAVAPRNVTLIGSVTDDQLRWLYTNCAGLIAAALEDFGLTPLEANLFGKPAVVVPERGYLESVVDGVNGVFSRSSDPTDIAATVRRAASTNWDVEAVRAHACRFSEQRFASRLRAIVAEVAGGRPAAGG